MDRIASIQDIRGSGLVVILGYGAIPTEDIEEGLMLLRSCFDA